MAAVSPPAPVKSKGPRPLSPQSPEPPDERFWVRYSPHHELPVSVAGSFLIHVLGFGLLALILVGLLSRLFDDTRRPEVAPLEILEPPGGGGGNPHGIGDGPGSGVLPRGKEEMPDDIRKPLLAARTRPDAPQPKEINKNPVPLTVPPPDAVSARAIQEQSTEAVLGQLSDIGKKARAQIDGLIAGKGKGGPGSGGGQGRGKSTGTGDLEGPGGKLDQRTKRQQRWVMNFNTRDGSDYLRQLQHLGAIVAVPLPDGTFRVYRDLGRRPLRGQVEDIKAINRIYWVDDKPDSVLSLAQALGAVPPPPYIAAFFPESLEKELRRQEERFYKGSEDNIEETRFHVTPRGGRYEPVLVTRPRLRGQ